MKAGTWSFCEKNTCLWNKEKALINAHEPADLAHYVVLISRLLGGLAKKKEEEIVSHLSKILEITEEYNYKLIEQKNFPA